MSISENLETFLGNKVVDWEKDSKIEDPEAITYRIRQSEYDTTKEVWLDLFNKFLQDPKVSQISALVIGNWPESYETSSSEIIDLLVSSADRLLNLKAIFFGDTTYEECEISWIIQSDMAPLLNAYPKLEHLTIRGGTKLKFTPVKLYNLKTLIIQTGGLPKEVIQGVYDSELPELEHLEFWLGDENYGADTTVEDLAPILEGKLFPKLKNLGLCNSEYQNDIAQAVAKSAIVNQLEVLNLSMGTLTDIGAEALLNCSAIKKLKKLDLHHHYCSNEMMEKLKALGIEIDLSEQEKVDGDEDEPSYYISVSE